MNLRITISALVCFMGVGVPWVMGEEIHVQDMFTGPQVRSVPISKAADAQNMLSPEAALDDRPLSAMQKGKVPSFIDLKFPEYLNGKTIEISNHESIKLMGTAVEAQAYGSTISLDLREKKLMAITFVGYTLGPYYPDQDPLGTYFQTLEAIEGLIHKKLSIQTTQDQQLLVALQEAAGVLNDFKVRCRQLHLDADFRYETEKLTQAVLDLYGGHAPENEDMEFNKEQDDWCVTVKHRGVSKPDQIAKREIRFIDMSGEYAVKEIRDLTYDGRKMAREAFVYDHYRNLQKHRLESYFPNGQLKLSSLSIYEGESKTNLYFNQYDESGRRLRHTNQTFYASGRIKTSSDYRYTIAKRYFHKYNPDGTAMLKSAQNYQRGLSAVAQSASL